MPEEEGKEEAGSVDHGFCEEKGELGEEDAVEVAGASSMLADRTGKVVTERLQGEVEFLWCFCACCCGEDDRVGFVWRG